MHRDWMAAERWEKHSCSRCLHGVSEGRARILAPRFSRASGDPRNKACLTFSSIPLRSTRSAACPSCKGSRSRAREGRPGSGPSASSRSRGALSSGVASKGGGKDGFRTTIGRRAPFDMVSAGDHCSRRMSRQMDPFALILRRTSRHQHPRLRFPRFACCFPRLLPGV